MFNFRALHETRAVFISDLFSLYCIIRSLILCLITLSQGLHGHSQLSYTLQYIDFSYAKNIFTWVHIKYTINILSLQLSGYILSISVHRFGQRLLLKLLDLLTATYSIEVQNIWDFTNSHFMFRFADGLIIYLETPNNALSKSGEKASKKSVYILEVSSSALITAHCS